MAEPRKAPGSSPRAVWCALLVSLTLHVPVLLGFFLIGKQTRREGSPLDSRVLVNAPFLLRLDSPPGSSRKGRGPDIVTVRVEQTPVVPAASAGPGPSVDVGTMPRVPSAPAGAGQERGTGGGTRGMPRFFGTPVEAQRVVFVIDRSLSMGPSGALAVAQAQLLGCLHALPPKTRFQVVLYNVSAEALPSLDPDGLLPADGETLVRIEALLRGVLAEGNTDHVRALRCGLALAPDVLFLVTDADDLTPQQVGEVTRLNQGHTAIHAIDVDDRHRGAEMLGQLARANRGNYFSPRLVAQSTVGSGMRPAPR
jgi:hypothetical protein